MKLLTHISKLRIFILFAIITASASFVAAQHGYRITKRVNFKKGQVSTTVAGTIPNTLEVHEYIVRAREGQTLMVKLHTSRAALGFYTMSPGNAMVEEETFLKHYTGTLYETGDYHIFVYTTKGAGKYTMEIQVASDI